MSLAATSQPQTSVPSATSSCVSCRRRKVRCSRTIPCSNCAKANTKCDYSLVGRKGRPKPAVSGTLYDKTAQSRLIEKIQRLEKIVENLSEQVDATRSNSCADGRHTSEASILGRPGSSTSGVNRIKEDADYEETGLLVSNDRGKFYVNGDFWSILRKEVRQVRESFEQEGEGNAAEGDDFEDTSNSLNSGTAFIFREANAFDRTLTDAMFPLPSQVHFIWQTFIERIDPLVKVLHVPSTTRVLEGCRGQIRTLCPDMQSLFACISFAAIQSMSDDDVLLNFGTDKVSLSSRYRRGAEQALSNADVINTTNLAPVQALTIYLNVLHADEPFRHVWAVIGILVRVALSLGLHRDGKFFKNISPFDAEMRRRLWWNVAILDARVGETQVSIAVICQAMFTTEAPANVDDADIHPGMTAPAVSRRGPTDVSILLGRCKIWRFGRALKGLSLDTAVIKGEVDGRQIYERKLEITRKFKKDMVEEYAATFHGDAGASAFIWAIIDVLTDRIELMAHYQFSLVEKQGSSFPHEAFRVALSIVERFHRIENDPDMAKWSWAAKGSVQWQAIGIILSHLCDVPWDEESEKAWQLIDYSFQDMVKAVTKEPLWKPFRRLFLRAKACRKRFSQIQNQDQTNQNQTQKTRDKGAVDTGQEGEWSGLVSRSAYSTTQSTYSTTVDVQGTIAGGTNGNEQRTDTTCISSAHSFQVINEDMGIGVTSLANGDNECGMAIDGSDIGPMDTNDWQQWNDWLQEGFWSFSGI